MSNLFDRFYEFMKPEVGDFVIVKTLLPAGAQASGGFPYDRSEPARVVSIGEASASSNGWMNAQYKIQWLAKNGVEYGTYEMPGHVLLLVKKDVK